MVKQKKDPRNRKLKIDALLLLDYCIDNGFNPKVCFFDPQYRGVLEKLNYGNEGSRQKERAKLLPMSESYIMNCIGMIDFVLMPSGYLFLWVDKFHLFESISSWVNHTSLSVVDMITWDKQRIGMGYRTRRQVEYLVILQKKPILAKTTWTRHDIRDIWSEKIDKKIHPHVKPINLMNALISATCSEGDIVIDPAAGSFGLMNSCAIRGMDFIGTDIETGEEEL